jgi:molecular chaperone HtpG
MLRLVTDDGAKVKTVTIDEYLESASESQSGKIYYTNDPSQQAQNISLLRNEGIDVAIFDLIVDSQYISAIEHYREDVKFIRVDSGITDIIKDSKEDSSEIDENLVELFKKVSGNESLTIVGEKLKNVDIPALLSVSEESRRMEDMMRLYSLSGDAFGGFPLDYTLTLNTASPIYSKLCAMLESKDSNTELCASYIYRLALLSQKKPSAEELSAFLADSYKILGLI